MRRVVVTGMGGVTSLGQNWETVKAGLLAHRNAVRRMHEWDDIEGLNARLGAPVLDFTLPEHYTRKRIRSMGRVSLLSTRATELALEQAGLIDDPVIKSGRTGIAYGSCTGSTRAVADFGEMIVNRNTRGITATTYVQMMPHTTAVNTGLFFGITGRVIPTPSACTSGSQAIGYAWEAIRHGYQDVMVAGGAEELCPSEVAVFDTLFAASTRNDEPELTPRPFDANRDGLVIGEGACTPARAAPGSTPNSSALRRTATPPTSRSPTAKPCASAWRRRSGPQASRPPTSAICPPTAPPPRAATAPSRTPRRRYSATGRPSHPSRASSATRSAPAVRSRPGLPSR